MGAPPIELDLGMEDSVTARWRRWGWKSNGQLLHQEVTNWFGVMLLRQAGDSLSIQPKRNWSRMAAGVQRKRDRESKSARKTRGRAREVQERGDAD